MRFQSCALNWGSDTAVIGLKVGPSLVHSGWTVQLRRSKTENGNKVVDAGAA